MNKLETMTRIQIRKALQILLAAGLVLVIFAGNRCEKQQGRPTTAKQDTVIEKDAAQDTLPVDADGAPDIPAVDAMGGDVPMDIIDAQAPDTADAAAGGAADALQDVAEIKPAKKIKFKKIPKIPSLKKSPKQPVADPMELVYLTDHEKTCEILNKGKWAKRKGMLTLVPMKRERVADPLAWRFRILLALTDDDDPITGFFKPRQEGYWDWLKEVHAYNIGRKIGAPTVPTVLRFFEKKSFTWWMNKKADSQKSMFKWEGKKNPRIRGALKYWVPSYFHRRFGKKIANEDYMTAIAKSLHPGNLEKLKKKYPLYLDVGRGIIFDYLIINEDRPENLGSILLPDGSYKLVLIDNGLSLGVEHGGRTVMKNMFKKMRIFPRDMIDKIKALDDDELNDMLRPPDDKVMWIPEICIEQLIKRRDDIIETVKQWHDKWGDIIWY